MGGEQSKGQPTMSYEEFLKKYEVHHRSDNDVQVLLEKGTADQFLGTREFSFSDETPFLDIFNKFEPRRNLNHQNIIQLYHVLKHKENQFCSTFYKIVLVFEHVENTLEQEIKNRVDLNQRFSEEEIWNILTQCILGLNYLYTNGLSHSNISSSTIYITSDGIVKVSEPSLLGQHTLYNRVFTSSDKSFPGDYFSPELLAAMYEQQLNPQYNQQKSDVFSLGMVAIQAALLQPLDEAYDYNACTVNQQVINDCLLRVQQIYGSNLSNFLAQMTAMNIKDRQDISTFDQILTGQQQQPDLLQIEEQIKRAPAQPNRQLSDVVDQPLQSTQAIRQTVSANAAPSMFRDADDAGSNMNFIPQDRISKTVIPDENIGNAIGGGVGANTTNSGYKENNSQNDAYFQQPGSDISMIQNQNIPNYLSQINTQAPTYYNISTNSNYHTQGVLPQHQQVQEETTKRSSANTTSSNIATVLPAATSQFPVTKGAASMSEDISQSGVYVSTRDQELQRQQLLNGLSTLPQQPYYQSTYTSTPQVSNSFTQPQTSNTYSTNIAPYQGRDNNTSYIPSLAGNTNLSIPNQVGSTSSYAATTINTGSAIGQPFQQSEEIEAILARFRNQQPQTVPVTITNTTIPTYEQKQQPVQNAYDNLNSQFGTMTITPSQQNLSSVSNIQAPPATQTYINPNIPYGQQSIGQSNSLQSASNINNLQQNQNIGSNQYTSTSLSRKEYVIENYSNNSRYEGEKQNGMRNGRGKFFYQDGGLYDGEWRDNKMHGKGVLSYASGKPAYDGDWVDDKFEGFGILFNENPAPFSQEYNYNDFDNVDEFWTRYEGSFKDDNKEGQGTLILSNGEKFVGAFFKDFVNGHGKFVNIYGQEIHGYWEENKLIQ